MIGGTIWKIKKETEEIVYAVDYNHKKERHLNPTVLETLNRPTLLITDAYSVLTAEQNMRNRDTELFGNLFIYYLFIFCVIFFILFYNYFFLSFSKI